MFYIQSYLMNSQKAPNIDSVLWVTVHDAVVMEKVCHMIVDDVGSDNVFWEEIWKVKHRE